ncbi:MAG: Crp/Fnr family transcriptional regulator [Pyrinomonadaceae bacterium]
MRANEIEHTSLRDHDSKNGGFNTAAQATAVRQRGYGAVGFNVCETTIASEVSDNAVLRHIPLATLKRLQPHLKRVELALDEFLYRPDEAMDVVYFPETAVISEFQILDDGRTIEVAMTGGEGAVGLLSIFSDCRAANWTQACAPGAVLKIQAEVLRRELTSNDAAQPVISTVIGSYVRQIAQKAACNAHHSVEERLCTWLLMLQDRCRTDRLRLTQEHVARVLGVYRPSVTCIAQALRDDGLIDYVRGYIIVKDRERLESRCCGCYAEFSRSTATAGGTLIAKVQSAVF